MICCIKGCDSEVYARHMCSHHYEMNRKHGSPIVERTQQALMRGLPVHERFMHKVSKQENGCWEWTGFKTSDGYGRFSGIVEDVIYRDAHRYSFAYYHDHPDGGKFVMHKCDNPGCVNPDHLTQGTPLENSHDMVRKGRNLTGAAAALAHAKLTEDQVREIAASSMPYAELAKKHGLHKQSIVDIKCRKSWSHLENLIVHRNKRGTKGADRSQNLNDDIVREIRISLDTGAALAKRYNVSQQTICDIRMRRSWKNVV